MNNTIYFYGDYTKDGVGTAPSAAPTIAVYAIDRATDAETEVVTGAAVTARALAGRYSYRLTDADLQTYDFHARISTTDATVDAQDLQAVWVRWSEAVATDENGDVTVGTNSDKAGYSLATAPPTAAQVATAVWTDTTEADFGTPWSPGYGLLPDGVIQSATATTATLSASDPTPAGAGARRFLSIVGGTGARQIRIVTVYTGPDGLTPNVATVDRPWDIVPDSTSSYQWGGYADVYDLRRVNEDGLTPRQLQTLIFDAVAAVLSGVPSSGTSGTITIRNGANSANRLAVGVDGGGNRTALSITPPGD